MRTAFIIFTASLFLGLAGPASAKRKVVKIAFQGPSPEAPIEVADQDFAEFSVYAGPGVRIDGVEQKEGFIIDWARCTAQRPPSDLSIYEVEFYGQRCRQASPTCDSDSLEVFYVVSYAYDPATGQGFVYLPNRSPNTQTIWRGGLEGNWFHETSQWSAFAQPPLGRD